MRYKLLITITIPLVLTVTGCSTFSPAEEKVVHDMYQSMCEEQSIAAMKPYLTVRSQSLLGFMKLALLTNGTLNEADAIAEGCSKGGVIIENKVRVNENRYTMDVYPPGAEQPTKIAVVKENGEWKVALGGK